MISILGTKVNNWGAVSRCGLKTMTRLCKNSGVKDRRPALSLFAPICGPNSWIGKIMVEYGPKLPLLRTAASSQYNLLE